MIRAIIHYFRQCRCDHEFIVEEFTIQETRMRFRSDQIIEPVKIDELVYMRCKKCGYWTRHRKKGS